jgi:predicted kinase
VLVVVSGLPGTGKTAVARAVARRLGAAHLSVDPVEDALLGAGLLAGLSTGIAAYEAVRAAAEDSLSVGVPVVVDAVNDSELARRTWRTAAERTGVPLHLVVLTMSDAVEHRRRLSERRRGLLHVPEPSWDDVLARAAAFESWSGDHDVVVADVALDDVVAAVLERLRLRGVPLAGDAPT